MFTIEHTIQENVPLAPLTTLGIGGSARYFLRAGSREAVLAGVRWAGMNNLPLLVLGGGSNMLIADEGFPGLALRIAMLGVEMRCSSHMVEVTAGAGEEWDTLVERSVAMNWAGLECLAGIPGLVGATPIQNVGAYEQEVGETIVHVDALDLTTGEIVTLSKADCRFGYRMSRFGREDQQRFIILAVTFRLTPGGAARVRHIEVQRHVRQLKLSQPTIAEIRNLVLDIRRRKGMLYDTTDPNTRSAGSFFINPLLNATQFAALEAIVTAHDGEETHIPHFPTADGAFKIPAAWLIEHSDFNRGYIRGNVGISEKHTLSLINRGGASARELVQLACEIRDRVHDRFGIKLLPEPRFVGISMAE